MNVFGAKTVMALIPLDLKMELQSSRRVQAIEDDDEDEQYVNQSARESR